MIDEHIIDYYPCWSCLSPTFLKITKNQKYYIDRVCMTCFTTQSIEITFEEFNFLKNNFLKNKNGEYFIGSLKVIIKENNIIISENCPYSTIELTKKDFQRIISILNENSNEILMFPFRVNCQH